MNSKQDSELAKIIFMIFKSPNTLAGRNEVSLAKKQFLESKRDPELVKAVNQLIAYLQNKLQPGSLGNKVNSPIEFLEILMKKEFPTSVTAALSGMDREISELGDNHLHMITLSEGLIDSWLKAKSTSGHSNAESRKRKLFERAASNPAEALSSALHSWFCKNIDTKCLRDAKPLLSEAAERHLKKLAAMLAILVSRDRTGDFVFDWISSSDGNLKLLIESSHLDQRLFEGIQKSGATWISHSKAKLLVDLYDGMHSLLELTAEQKRANASAQLLSLAASLIPLAEKNPVAAEILQRLQAISLSVWNKSSESPDRRHTWAIIQSGKNPLGSASESPLSPESAAILGLALRKSRKGKDAITELESALVNIGVERFGETGTKASYDPLQHDDTDGGLIPGDTVTVIASGFRYAGKVIVKASVLES